MTHDVGKSVARIRHSRILQLPRATMMRRSMVRRCDVFIPQTAIPHRPSLQPVWNSRQLSTRFAHTAIIRDSSIVCVVKLQNWDRATSGVAITVVQVCVKCTSDWSEGCEWSTVGGVARQGIAEPATVGFSRGKNPERVDAVCRVEVIQKITGEDFVVYRCVREWDAFPSVLYLRSVLGMEVGNPLDYGEGCVRNFDLLP